MIYVMGHKELRVNPLAHSTPGVAILDFGQCRLLNLTTYFGINLKKQGSVDNNT
jgi:hypothetical protein